jgi:hypothetical protein
MPEFQDIACHYCCDATRSLVEAAVEAPHLAPLGNVASVGLLPPMHRQRDSANSPTTTSSTTSHTSNTSNTSNVTSTSSAVALTLSWTAPVTRSDGTPLSLADIDGFYLYYGTSPGNYPNHVNVTDGTTQEVTLNNLAVGTYYIVMTTYDVDGRESSYSVMVKKATS